MCHWRIIVIRIFSGFSILIAGICPGPSIAQKICISNKQANQTRLLISARKGSLSLAWLDGDYSFQTLFTQYFNQQLRPMWGPTQILASNENSTTQGYHAVAGHPDGGLTIVWVNDVSGLRGYLYSRRIDRRGTVSQSHKLCSGNHIIRNPEVIIDSRGYGFVMWDDWRSGFFNIYIQPIMKDGTPRYSDGIPLYATDYNQLFSEIIPMTGSSAVISWCDRRDGNIYAPFVQKISSTGQLLWGEGGIQITTGKHNASEQCLTSDREGGVVVGWVEYKNGNHEIFIQRVDGDGLRLWGPKGIKLCTIHGIRRAPVIKSNGIGEFYVLWSDHRNDNWCVYAQKVDSYGKPQWKRHGVLISDPLNDAYSPAFGETNSEGLYVLFEEFAAPAADNIKCVHISEEGELVENVWELNPEGSRAIKNCSFARVGQSVYVAYEQCINNDADVFLETFDCQRLLIVPKQDKEIIGSSSREMALRVFPNPGNPSFIISYSLPAVAQVKISIYSITGMLVTDLVDGFKNEGVYDISWDGRNNKGIFVNSGVFFCRISAGSKNIMRKVVVVR